MKLVYKFAHILMCAAMLSLAVVSCKKEQPGPGPDDPEVPVDTTGKDTTVVEEPVLTIISLDNVTETSFTVKYSYENLTEVAYALLPQDEIIETSIDVFDKGVVSEITEKKGENSLEFTDLNPGTAYSFYLAGKINDEYFSKFCKEDFTTKDFEPGVTVLSVSQDEFSVRVVLPELQESENVVKWGTTDIATYLMNKNGWFPLMDADILNLHDEYYHNYFRNDTTFVFNTDNSYLYDENGNIKQDEEGNLISYYNPIVPGQPNVLMFGEYTWGEHPYGFGEGFYQALFDENAYYDAAYEGPVNEEDYWTGFFFKKVINTLPPSLANGTVSVTTDLTPKGGKVTFTPSGDIMQYVFVVMDEYTLEMIMPFINNDEANLQWYLTSFNAFMQLGVMLVDDVSAPAEINLEDMLYEIDKNATYHIFAVGLADEYGYSQSFTRVDFTLPEATKPAPKVIVTPIDNPWDVNSPYMVWFNVKAPNKDLESAKYAANGPREFSQYLKYYDYNQVMEQLGNELSEADVNMINSADGLDMSFNCLPNTVTRLVIAGANDEGTYEDLTADDCQAISEQTSIRVPAATKVESTLFDELQGEWTASATVSYSYYDDNWQVQEGEEVFTSPVVIGDPTYPEVLPQSVYDLYANYGYDKESTDLLYEEFKYNSQILSEDVRSQNRLLCLGFDFCLDFQGNVISARSPYDLFLATDYNAYDIPSMFYDFGNKWYLQIEADGSVKAPFSSSRFYPANQWALNQSYPIYLAGIGNNADGEAGYLSDDEEIPAFPVEISADKNTITIKALQAYGYTFYPNVGYISYGQFNYLSYKVISEVTLTRNTSYAPANEAPAQRILPEVKKISDSPVAPSMTVRARPYARTIMVSMKEKAQPFVITNAKIMTGEQFKENVREYIISLRTNSKRQ